MDIADRGLCAMLVKSHHTPSTTTVTAQRNLEATFLCVRRREGWPRHMRQEEHIRKGGRGGREGGEEGGRVPSERGRGRRERDTRC